MVQRNLTLLTDLYEPVMMQGYFKEKDANETVIFGAFYRSNPNSGGHSVCTGLEQVIEYVKNLHFDKEDVDYLRTTGLSEEGFLDYPHHSEFTRDICVIPEGTVVFPWEPLVKVIAPIMEAQLVETAILNIINHQSLTATKTTRVIYAIRGDGAMESGLRQTQGPDVGIYGARTAMIAGCIGTSSVLADQMFGAPIKDTHAHSQTMNFPDELAAFRTHAESYPSACIPPVDTYDTLKSDVPNAIEAFNGAREAGVPLTLYGIRPDSGDLAYLSKKAKKMLGVVGFPDAVISASNNLDENLISSLKLQGATINSWGVGTSLITSKDCPSFDDVYKLVAVKGKKTREFIPKIKLSENIEKITNPGNKAVQRTYNKETGKIIAGLICLVDETYNSRDPLLPFDPAETRKRIHLAPDSYAPRELIIPASKDGVCIYESPKVTELQAYCKSELAALWKKSLRLKYPHRTHVGLSQSPWNMRNQLLDNYHFQG